MKVKTNIAAILFILAIAIIPMFAQSPAFTYQGTLADGSQPANGNYDFEFRLYDSLTGGTQLGSSVVANGVNVADGVFTVTLDFGGQFPGANRWLEILVRQSTGASSNEAVLGATTLSPRQRIASTPYAVKSLNSDTATNAAQLGGVASSEYVVTTDPRMTNARTPTSGSGAYIQNSPTTQSSSRFTIDGTGKAAVFDAPEYKLGTQRVLWSQGNTNMFFGVDAGDAITSGSSNLFAGSFAGTANTTGSSNSFFGQRAGQFSEEGNFNSFFGGSSGQNNIIGSRNSFFGYESGTADPEASDNAYFGYRAGSLFRSSRNSVFGSGAGGGAAGVTAYENSLFGFESGKVTVSQGNSYFGANSGLANTTGNFNSFFGHNAGKNNTIGSENTFAGRSSGDTNVTGNNLTVVGNLADVSSTNLSFATAIGAQSVVSTSNTVVLGRSADRVSMPGTATIGNQTTNYGQLNINAPSTNANFYMSGDGATKGINFGVDSTTTAESKLFISQYDGATYLDRLTINENGEVGINVLGQAGSTSLCRNALNLISTCSSSIRYKSNIEDFRPGLSLIRELRPVSFNWTEGGTLDVGLVAEEVAKVEPLLTTTRDGKVEGVKYDRVGVVLVNAVQEQQSQIEQERQINRAQQEEIVLLKERIAKQEAEMQELRRKQEEFEQLKTLVCTANKTAEVCN